ncbi:MAG: cysteine desulfurase [Alphaproteobacteria bacterium]|nr:cysteine desulfurase [Alphaproteobacteria bacterium]
MPARLSYLDWNATAPVRPEAAAAVARALTLGGNPSSVHRAGRAARRLVEAARAEVAALVGAQAEDVVFTSGGTEANTLALQAFPDRRLLISAIEHDSVMANAPQAVRIPATRDGRADLAALERLLVADRRPALVSLMFANNETGAVQPVADGARLAHAHGALFHCDAIQGAGRQPIDIRRLGCDLLTLSAHKLGGPMGVGALIVASGLDIVPLIHGGGQERGRRAGTENLPGIAGFGAAALAAVAGLAAWPNVAALREQAESRLLAITPDAVIHAAAATRLPNTICISMPGVPAATQVMALDLAGVMVSAGAACSSGKVRRSHVLDAMGVREREAECAIRVSLGWNTTATEIDHLVEAWGALYARTRASAA